VGAAAAAGAVAAEAAVGAAGGGGAGGGGGGGGGAALAAEQRLALAGLGRMWTWAPAAVAGMGETALGGCLSGGE
jgi:hypothetical protein